MISRYMEVDQTTMDVSLQSGENQATL
ncbi:MAG: cell division topological specificity factor, partial [Zestosphaera sp.]